MAKLTETQRSFLREVKEGKLSIHDHWGGTRSIRREGEYKSAFSTATLDACRHRGLITYPPRQIGEWGIREIFITQRGEDMLR